MNPFTRAVLRILSQSDVAIGWYQIERRLSNMALDERPHLPTVLAELIDHGLVAEVSAADEPKIKYVVTKLGREVIAS